MSKVIRNMAASVHDRLLEKAKQDNRPFNELLQYFAMDRFLYRWSKSAHAMNFILKGAMMLRVWQASTIRPTMDIDMLGKASNSEDSIATIIKDVISVPVDADGLDFSASSVTVVRITEDADYHGLRINFIGHLGNAEITMQVDVGFGDIVYPMAQTTEIPAMLNFPPARLLCYSRESVIAEKLEAAISLGEVNSRMKDFFDIWILSHQFDFDGERLAEAIRLTFKQRGTELLPGTIYFSKDFVKSKQTQWAAFRRKLRLEYAPESFDDVVGAIGLFINPIAVALGNKTQVPKHWNPPGPWKH